MNPAGNFSSIGQIKTNASPSVSLLSPELRDAERVLGQISNNFLNTPNDVLFLMEDLSNMLLVMTGHSMDELVPSMENRYLQNGELLNIESETDSGKVTTVLGTYFHALNLLDTMSTSTSAVSSLQAMFTNVESHIYNRIGQNLKGTELRKMSNVMSTIEKRFTDVIKSLNERVDAGQIGGPKLSTG